MHHSLIFYTSLIGCIAIGCILRQIVTRSVAFYAYQFVAWIGAPILVITSVKASGIVTGFLVIPLIALVTIAMGALFLWIVIDLGKINERIWSIFRGISIIENDKEFDNSVDIDSFSINSQYKGNSQYSKWQGNFQSSFLSVILGDTKYIGFPLVLMSLGSEKIQNFTWAVVFDLFAITFALYAISIFSCLIRKQKLTLSIYLKPIKGLLQNKIFWSLIIGFILSSLKISDNFEIIFDKTRSLIIPLCLIAIAMQINLPSFNINLMSSYSKFGLAKRSFKDKYSLSYNPYYFGGSELNQTFSCLAVKMLITPLVMAALLILLNIRNLPILVIFLQIAMPPLLINSDFCKEYNISDEFNIAASSIGYLALAFTMPIWIFLFSYYQ